MTRSLLKVSLLVVFCLFSGTGCLSSPIVLRPEPESPHLPVSEGWTVLQDGMSVRTYTTAIASGDIRVYRFEKGKFDWVFRAGDPKTVSQWSESIEGEVAVANGVYFHEDFLPSGLLIADGARVGGRAFDLDKTAVISLGTSPRIIDTSANESFDEGSAKNAGQSYPLLVRDGAPAVREDSGLTARRTAFGVDEGGNAYLLLAVDEEPTLFQFAQAIHGMDIAWDRVINLDGGPSSGIQSSLDPEGSVDSFTPVPNVIVAIPHKGT